jgi:TrmH family RNA methyltransferase
MKKLASSRSYRTQCGEFICDGIKLLEEAVLCHVEVIAVLTAESIPFPLPAETKLYNTSHSIIESISPLQNAQKTLFICKIKPINIDTDTFCGTHVLLDKVQDPGNVGTVVRSAFAFGFDSVILTDGCADLYNPKTIRASMGATFKQKVICLDLAQLASLKENGVKFIGAVAAEESLSIKDVKLSNSVIVIGNEGQGISDEIHNLCEVHVKVPINPNCESLNAAVAASILMWEAAKDYSVFK